MLKSVTAALAATAGLALVAAPALASAPYTVAYDGDTSGASHSTTWTAKGDTILSANGNTYTCSNSQLTTTVHTGTNATGNDIADVTAATWTGCTFTGLLNATVTVTSPSWHFNATGGNTSGTSDTISGTLTNISNVSIDIAGPFGDCTFNVSGSVGGSLAEDNGKGGQELDVSSSNLAVSNVNNAFTCLGLVSNGNAATFAGSYNVPGQHLNIS